jgi:hypothetical protein
MLASVGSVDDAYEDALVEGFAVGFKIERVAARVWPAAREPNARRVNTQRRCAGLGRLAVDRTGRTADALRSRSRLLDAGVGSRAYWSSSGTRLSVASYHGGTMLRSAVKRASERIR